MWDTFEYAFGKLNLSLDIVGKQENGYHLLQMVMQSVSLHDTLLASLTQDGRVTLTLEGNPLPAGDDNLCVKAAHAFLHAIGETERGITLHLQKQIPSQAGMGGGSSDAAAVLRLMNRLFAYPLTEEELCRIGLTLGADVPFCVRGGTQKAEGVGEILTPLPTLSEGVFVLCKPPFGISTPQAFAKSDAEPIPPTLFTPGVEKAVQKGDLLDVAAHVGNRFETVLQDERLAQIVAAMKQSGAAGACMTGSGSVVFGVFSTLDTAFAARKNLRPYGRCFVCRPVTDSFLESV